jgi:ferric-dicitrate binding protein FerR (iron transport regulator)
MNCDGIRTSAHEYLKGWLEPREAQAVRSHLDGCPACSQEHRTTGTSLALLEALPEISALPETWKKIEARLAPVPATAARPGVFRFWLRTAAAASLLVAVASFILLAAMPRSGALPVVVETHKALNWSEPFTAPAYAQIEIPDVGILKLKENTTLRLAGPRLCLLERGEVFAEIIPSGRGFELRSGETIVTVHGTKFGVAATGAVYVVEGRVAVASPRGRLELTRGQAVNEALVEVNADDYLHWLARYERPDVRLTLDPRDQTTITPGAPLKWNLILETDALAPLYLGKPRDLSQFLTLVINDTPVPLDAAGVGLKTGGAAPNGLVRLDVAHGCILECAVDPALFHDRGRASVRAVYTSGAQAPEGAWIGTVRSAPVLVEVK